MYAAATMMWTVCPVPPPPPPRFPPFGWTGASEVIVVTFLIAVTKCLTGTA